MALDFKVKDIIHKVLAKFIHAFLPGAKKAYNLKAVFQPKENMMKKRYIQTLFTAMAVVLFTSCTMGGGGAGKPDTSGTGDGETSILFKNESPYAVDVYSDPSSISTY